MLVYQIILKNGGIDSSNSIIIEKYIDRLGFI